MSEGTDKPACLTGEVGRLTPARAAEILKVPEEIIQKDISEGAPLEPDGSLNLIRYAAWLISRLKNGHRPSETHPDAAAADSQ